MKIYHYSLQELGVKAVDLGKRGENRVREIEFDLRDWIAEYPGASVALYVSQPNTTVYLAATKLEEGILKWPILNTYTATPGFGSAEIVMSGKSGERLKSATANIFVSESMSEDEQGEAPEYMKPYADQVAENAAKAEKALEEIKNIGTQPGKMPTGGESGQILAKKSNADYDTHWINPPEGGTGGSDPDAVKSVTVNGTKHEPDEDGNVDLGTIRGGEGGAQYINELLPDPNEESVDEENVVLPVKADDSDKLGGKAPEYYLQPVNLLDNSDWRIKKNIVNQRGQSGYNGNAYTIDRWILWSDNGTGSVSIEDGQLAFNPGTSSGMSVAQRIEKGVLDSAKTYTLAWCDHANNIHVRTDRVSYGSAYDYVDFIVTEWVGVKWAALYEGAYTAETLPPYVAPDPVLELAKCKNAYKIIYVTMKPTFMSGIVRVYRVAYGDIRPTLNAPTIEILYADERNVWSSTGATFTVEAVDQPNKVALIYASGVTVDNVDNCYADIRIACIADL